MKKFLIAFLTALLGILCAIGLVACGGGSTSVKGTYYYYENGNVDKTKWVELNSNEWKDCDGLSGTYEVSDDEIVFYVDLLGSKEIISRGTVKDGVLTVDTAGVVSVFCKDGAKPSNSPNTPIKPSTEKVTITYHANGGKFANESETFSQTVNKNALLTAPDSPVRTNYTFAGWATSKNGSSMWKFDEDRAADGITLWAKWTEKSAVILSVDGASINGNNIFMLVNQNTDAVSLSNKVVCSTDSVWRLYYDRLGQTEIPTKMAAGLSGYLANGNNVFYMVVTSQDGVQTNLYELTVHRSYAVSVNYYNGVQLLKSESVYTGNTFMANYTPQIDGYTFNGWKDGEGNAINEFAVWAGKSLFADKTANNYTVRFNVNGGDNLSATEQTVIYDNEYRFAVPTKTGHSFLGWYFGSTQVTDGTGKIAAWKIADDATLTAKWEANTYTLTVTSNNTNMGTVTGGGDYKYGSNVTLTASTKDGYTFTGWFNGNEEVSRKLSYTLKMGFTASYTAKWIRCPVSVYSDNTSIGTVFGLPAKTVVGERYTVTATKVNLGYNFLGWYQESNKLNSNYSFTFTMPSTGSVTYMAKYEMDSAMSNFNFTSTQSACAITGVKNKNATEILIPDYVTSIGENAFSGCSGLTGISVVNGNTKYHSNGNCLIETNSKTLVLGCKNSIIPTDDTVTSIGSNAFNGCSGLTSVTIPDSVTSIGQEAFSGCSGLTSITIPFVGASKNETSNTHFGYIFGAKSSSDNSKYVPSSLESVILTGGTRIGSSAFSGCSELMSITIPDSVTNIGDWAFSNCSGLTSVTIPDSVTNIGMSAFSSCNSLETIIVSEHNSNYASQDGILYDKGKTQLVAVPHAIKGAVTIPDNVTRIGSSAFSGCSGLISITIPDSVTSIGRDAFKNCSSLQYNEYDNAYYLGNDTNKYLTLIKVKDKLATSCTIHNTIKTVADAAFSGCSGLTSITIPNSVTSIGSDTFSGCSGLTSVTIPDSVTSIGERAFSGCSGLISITIPNSVTSIGRDAFFGCKGLTSITVSNGNTKYYSEGNCLIETESKKLILGCKNSVIPADGIVTSIGNSAFYGCNGLTSILIPDSVTIIGGGAFSGCSGLTSVTIGNGVTSIGYNAFFGCNKLTDVTFADTSDWKVSRNSDMSNSTSLTSSNLSNSYTAAQYLKSTYTYHYWKRG